MTTTTANCKTCGAPFEKAIRYGAPVATVNCPGCRAGAKAAKAEAAKAKAGAGTVEFRGPAGFAAINAAGEVVATGIAKGVRF
jgi:hypothetical protein